MEQRYYLRILNPNLCKACKEFKSCKADITFAEQRRYGSDINCVAGVAVPCPSNGVKDSVPYLAMTAIISMHFHV